MTETDRHDPYVCTGCGEPIPEGTPHDVIGFSTVCPDCKDRYDDTETSDNDEDEEA